MQHFLLTRRLICATISFMTHHDVLNTLRQLRANAWNTYETSTDRDEQAEAETMVRTYDVAIALVAGINER